MDLTHGGSPESRSVNVAGRGRGGLTRGGHNQRGHNGQNDHRGRGHGSASARGRNN